MTSDDFVYWIDCAIDEFYLHVNPEPDYLYDKFIEYIREKIEYLNKAKRMQCLAEHVLTADEIITIKE